MKKNAIEARDADLENGTKLIFVRHHQPIYGVFYGTVFTFHSYDKDSSTYLFNGSPRPFYWKCVEKIEKNPQHNYGLDGFEVYDELIHDFAVFPNNDAFNERWKEYVTNPFNLSSSDKVLLNS